MGDKNVKFGLDFRHHTSFSRRLSVGWRWENGEFRSHETSLVNHIPVGPMGPMGIPVLCTPLLQTLDETNMPTITLLQ